MAQKRVIPGSVSTTSIKRKTITKPSANMLKMAPKSKPNPKLGRINEPFKRNTNLPARTQGGISGKNKSRIANIYREMGK